MRKLLLSILVLGLVAPAALSAQSGTVQASATIDNYALVTWVRDLNFGSVSRAAPTVKDEANKAENGAVMLEYNYGGQLTITPPTLTNTSVAATLPMTLTCASGPDDDNYVTRSCVFAKFSLPTTQQTLYLGFGGTILDTDVVTRPAGTYEGDITITIAP